MRELIDMQSLAQPYVIVVPGHSRCASAYSGGRSSSADRGARGVSQDKAL